MIRIKDYIFNENEIEYIKSCTTFKENGTALLVETNGLNVKTKKKDLLFEDATFEDIEWNYEDEQIRKCLDGIDREEELEEENKKLNELVQFNVKTTATLTKRINKAIEYIGSITDVKVRYFNYREFEKQGLHISNEELKKRVKEQKLEGQYIEIDRDDLLKILKGEE